MKTKPTSWKDLRDQRHRENFVGRKQQVAAFKDNFLGEAPEYLVFSITGEGGVGKSTLLEQYATIARAPGIGAMVVACDDRHTTAAAAMGHIAAELAKLDIAHKEFDERYRKYRELREEVESDPKAPRGAIDLVARGAADLAIKSGRQVPGLGVFLEGADEKAAGETLAQGVNYLISRWTNKDEVMLLRETDRVLTPLFLQLLAKASESRRLVLLFDVFERTSESLSPWLLSLFSEHMDQLNTNQTFVIAGRDPLEQHWTELAGNICHIALEAFTPDETRIYLANQDITDEQLVARIHADTGGLPVLVELLAATRPQPDAPLQDVSKEAVERFLQWIPPKDRRVALLAALPRQFNRDILGGALGGDATEDFNWLSGQSFVRRNAERGCFYHEKVRELMLRHLRHTTPKELEAAHARLAAWFAGEQAALNLAGEAAYESETWRQCECERVYHTLSAQPDRNSHEAVNAFLHASRWNWLWHFAPEIAQACRQCGKEKSLQTIGNLGDILSEIYRAYEQNEYQTGIEKLGLLERRNGLTVTAQCEFHRWRGYMFRWSETYDQALADYNRAVELDEKNARPIAGRGETYRLMGKHDEALRDFDRAIELDEKDAWTISRRGAIYGFIGKYEEALKDYDRAIQLGEEDAWVISLRGQIYQAMRKHEEALKDFDRAVELDEKYAWAIALRGETYQAMGKHEEALKDFDRAIELDEELDWAIGSRGETYQAMGKHEEALKDFDRAIELDEKYVWAIAYRGWTYQAMGKHEEALKDFDRAIELDEKYAWAIASRGQIYQAMDKYEEALKDFDLAIELNEKLDWAIASRGETYRLMDRHEEALKDFDRAIELDEKYVWAITNRGRVYQAMGKHEEALKDFDRAIELDEKSAWAITYRGEIYRLMDRHEEALKDFDRAIELDEKDAWAIASRGLTYQLMGKYEEALKDFDRAIELNEKYAEAIASRGLTYQLMDKYDVALADYNRALALEPEDVNANMALAACYRKLGLSEDYERQIAIARELVANESDYTRACFAAICGETDEAFALLRAALETREEDVGWVRRDPDFEWIRDDSRFAALLEEMAARP